MFVNCICHKTKQIKKALIHNKPNVANYIFYPLKLFVSFCTNQNMSCYIFCYNNWWISQDLKPPKIKNWSWSKKKKGETPQEEQNIAFDIASLFSSSHSI